MLTANEVRELISDPAYSHSRQGDRLWRDGSFIYHFDPASPTGVHVVGFAVNSLHDPILREMRNNSSLSPTER